MTEYNLLIEGCDRVGKSRFIKEWLNVFTEFELIKTLPNQDYATSVNNFNNLMLGYNRPGFQLHDRSHLSEIAYTKMYRLHNVNHVYPDILYDLERYITKPTFIVYFYPETQRIMQRDNDRVNGLGLGFELLMLSDTVEKSLLPKLITTRHKNGRWEEAMNTVFRVIHWLQEQGVARYI